jgi:cell wall-associated NlpC family hydrolase
MSLEAAIGRIDQIQQLQEQLFPAATTSPVTGGVGLSSGSAATSSTAGPTQATGSTTNGTNFAAALAGAQAASTATSADQTASLDATTTAGGGLDAQSDTAVQNDIAAQDTTGDATDALTDPLSSGLIDSLSPAALSSASGVAATTATSSALDSAPAAVQAMVSTANSLVGKPYIWGGGHSGWGPSTGYDCSGFVSAVLHGGGYLSSPQDTQTLPSSAGIATGPGQYVTIYDRTDAGSGNDHVIIDLGGQFYEAGGGAGSWGGGGGVEQIGTPSAAYLASFNQILHPVGL